MNTSFTCAQDALINKSCINPLQTISKKKIDSFITTLSCKKSKEARAAILFSMELTGSF